MSSGSTTSTTRRVPATVVSATCRICRQQYDPNDPNDLCRHHPGELRGESPRKGNWEDNATELDNTELVVLYECCGQPEGSEGCVVGPHKSYDDP